MTAYALLVAILLVAVLVGFVMAIRSIGEAVMPALAITGPRIQAKGYTRGRRGAKVTWIVVHTAEGARDERDLGNFFRSTSAGSSHVGIGQDGGLATYVNYSDSAWTAPPLNEEADQVELCGFARWGRAQWLAHPKMLDTLARWIAWRCAVRQIPLRYVAYPKPGLSGVTGHRDVNKVYRKSSHWDPGPQFPWDMVIAKARAHAQIRPPAPSSRPLPGSVHAVVGGDTYWKLADTAYKDGSKWPAIAKANGNKELKPGMRVQVPRLGPAPKPPPPKPRIDLPPWPGYGHVAYGKKSSYVAKMQAKLRRLDPAFARLNPSGPTGLYGKETRAMVAAFQRKRPALWPSGAKGPDGICGPKTWMAIDAA